MEKGLLSYEIIRQKCFLPQSIICGICHQVSFCKYISIIENGSMKKLHNDSLVNRWVCTRGKDVLPVLWLYGHTFGWGKRRCYLYVIVHILSGTVCPFSMSHTDLSTHCMMPISCFILLVLVKNKAGLLTHLPCITYLALDDINQDHTFSHTQSPLLKCL